MSFGDGSTRSAPHDESFWEGVAASVDAFVKAWDAAPPDPDLADFIPRGPHGQGQARQLALVELVKVDLEYRWRSGHSRQSLDDYLARWPELIEPDHPPLDLVYEEIQVRRTVEDVAKLIPRRLQQFPLIAEPLRRMLEGDAQGTTAIWAKSLVNRFDAGDRIDDFDLLTRLGQGAFAQVFLARQRSMQRLVALKISADHGAEPQTLAQLDHPHIVRVYDQRTLTESNLRLLYMQYISGGTLADALLRLRAHPPDRWCGRMLVEAIDQAVIDHGESPQHDAPSRLALSRLSWPDTVARLGRELALALDYAHQRGVLHRDLKPANVLLTAGGQARLADFNVSYCSKLDGASPAAQFGGSLAYMSPEQLEAMSPRNTRRPDDLDGRSDQFALGVILYELWRGVRPFPSPAEPKDSEEVIEALIAQRQAGVPPHDRDRDLTHCPPPLRQAIERCLEYVPERRFQSAVALARWLGWCADSQSSRLVFDAPKGLLKLASGSVLWTVWLSTLIPNVLAAWFIYTYNLEAAVPRPAHRTFFVTQLSINAVAFFAGMALLYLISRPHEVVLRAEGRRSGTRSRGDPRAAAQSLPRLGNRAAMICFWEWALAGLLYPIILSLSGVRLPTQAWGEFIASHVLAGATAAVYIFFLVSWFVARVWMGHSIRRLATCSRPLPPAASAGALVRHVTLYQMLSASIPLATIATLVVFRAAENRFALGVLSVVGLVGFGICFSLARGVQSAAASFDRVLDDPGASP